MKKHWIMVISIILMVALSAIGATAEGLEIIPEDPLKVLMPEEEVTELEDFDLRGDSPSLDDFLIHMILIPKI